LDETDERILRILEEDARASYVDIGKKLRLSEGAVRRRIQNLVEEGVIKKFTIQREFTRGTKAIVLISVNTPLPTPEVSKALRKIEGVQLVYEVTGQYDIAVFLSGASITEVDHCLEEVRQVKGVMNTNTLIILREW
jgi:Lrp/AsnC family leucine-responsive transcriptional regulator